MLRQLISLVLLPIAVDGIGFGLLGGSGGCGCGMQMPPLILPSLTPPPIQSGCNFGCGRKKRHASRPTAIVDSDDRKCNNDKLKEIIMKGIEKNQSQAKMLIHSEIRAELGGNWVVICAPQQVSFVTQSQQYCLHGYDNTWCYTFQID